MGYTGFQLQISAGGTILSSGAAVFSGSTPASGGVITLGSSGGIAISTNIPENAEASYRQYIADKRSALIEGGVASFNGYSQTFASGYKVVQNKYLMSLNNVKGYPDSINHTCNLNINPSVGFWTEPVSGGIVMRTLPPCITCTDYNNIYATEMVLYHAINRVAWQLMDIGIHNTDQVQLTGTWYRYQGLLAYWSFLVYSDAFLSYNCSVRENLAVNVGYANPTCDACRMVCISIVTPTSFSTSEVLQSRLIFYPGNMITHTPNKDNNVYTSGDPIPFIIGSASGSTLLYCGGAPTSDLLTLVSGATISGTAVSTTIANATVVNNIQQFTERTADTPWSLGLAANLGGQSYAAQPYTLGIGEGSDSYVLSGAALDTYQVSTLWWVTGSGGVLEGPYTKTSGGVVLHTYALTTPEV